MKKELEDFGDFPRARLEKRLPVVLSHQEVQEVLRRMDGVEAILARPRTRPEITDRFPISSSGHLGPLGGEVATVSPSFWVAGKALAVPGALGIDTSDRLCGHRWTKAHCISASMVG